MLAQRGRIALTIPAKEWIDAALTHPNVSILEMTPHIAIDAVELPEPLHRDPADRILIATARAHGCRLLTLDRLILAYPHVVAV